MQLAANRKNYISKEEVKTMPTHELLQNIFPPGAVERLSEWQGVYDDAAIEGGTFLADIDHHPGSKGPNGGADFPSQLTHGNIVSFSSDARDFKLFTSMEHVAALGFHMFQQTPQVPVSKMQPILQHLSPQQMKIRSGSGMHLVAQSAWMLYVLANIVPTDVPLGKPLPSTRPCEDDEWEA